MVASRPCSRWAFTSPTCWRSRCFCGDHVPNVSFFWNTIVIMTLQLTSQLGMQRATRSATRDMLARPLLGSLPISPRDTLAAKAGALRRSLLLIAAPLTLANGHLAIGIALGCPSWVGASRSRWSRSGFTPPRLLTWRFSRRAWARRGRVGGAFGSLESFLVIIPFASVLFAAGPGSAAISLLTLAALTFEARRAAHGSIEWLDDPEREHSTEVWKALVVFGAFQGRASPGAAADVALPATASRLRCACWRPTCSRPLRFG